MCSAVRDGREAAWRALIVAAALLVGVPRLIAAEEPLNPAVPLQTATVARSAGNIASDLEVARRAHEIGLPSVAISLYRQLLASANADPSVVTLSLASALIDAGRAAEAEEALRAAPGGRPPEWRLRLGLAAAQQKKWDIAREQVNSINVDDLQRSDRAWFWFLQAIIADAAVPRDVSRANENYLLAQQEAPSEMALATFLAAGLRARLTLVNYTAADIEQARQQFMYWEQRGSQEAYRHAIPYAIMRAASGQREEAVSFLAGLLVSVPRAEREVTDDLRRLLGLIGDRSRDGRGRRALNELLESGNTPDYQRQALLILAQDSQREPERGLFRAQLDRLLARTPRHPIYDALLLERAQLALGDTPRDYGTAERRANELKDNFPGSPLRPHAFAVLTTSAWEQQRYRVAAENARLTRDALAATPAATAPRQARSVAQRLGELRVLEAEARFRAGDYRLAADAYGAALQDAPAGIPVGNLLFQRALATIRAGADNPAVDLEAVVTELIRDARFDAENRWEAEWSLARGLNLQGKTEAALRRVTAVLENPSTAVRPELRALMSWLQVKLSIDAGAWELTLQLVPRLLAMISDLEPPRRSEIGSTATLFQAQAQFRLDRKDAALDTLRALRSDYPATDAAAHSYLAEAEYYAEPGRDQIQNAQQALRALVDDPTYQRSEYVPHALFRMALLSAGLGQEEALREANERIEELVKRDTAPADLVFAARLKQGDILRTLNRFAEAQFAYEDLVNNPKYALRGDRVYAQLRLAECHNAQSSNDPTGSHADIAAALFEELLYRVAAPSGVRIEAGYNLGKLLERRGQFEKARDVWWRGVLQPFLIDRPADAAWRANEPYWLARTLNDLGALLVQRENIDEARRVYVLLRDSNLGYGEDTATEQLKRLGMGGAASVATANP